MRHSNLRYVSLAALALSGAIAAQACSPSATEDPPIDTDSGVADTGVVDSGKKDTGVAPLDSGKDTGTTPADTGVSDTGTPADTGVADASADATSSDAASDGGADASVAPATGSACATPGVTFTKSCGFCGKSSAFCEADNKVGIYGFCQGNVVGGCTPGTQRNGSCGLCGTRQEICQNTCQWAGGACLGEPADACSPGNVTYTQIGCAEMDKFRKVTCGATCQYSLPEPPPCGPKGPPEITLGNTVGLVRTTEAELSTFANAIFKHDGSGTCPKALSTTAKAPFVYIKVNNPNPTAAVVDIFGGDVPGGIANMDTVMTSYTALPATDAARVACTGIISDTKPFGGVFSPECTAAPSGYGTLCGADAVTVPANGSVYVFVQSYLSSATHAGKPFKLGARLNSL